jgi:hypothetical protein
MVKLIYHVFKERKMETAVYIIENLKWYVLGACIVLVPPFLLYLRFKRSEKKGLRIYLLGWFIPLIAMGVAVLINNNTIESMELIGQITKLPIVSIVFFIVGLVKGGKSK